MKKRSIRSVLSTGFKTLALTALFLAPCAAQEAQAGMTLWNQTNLQYLWGGKFKLQENSTQSTITIEHANGWKYGDNFLFFDVTNPDRENAAIYGELSPRLSLGKITGRDLSAPLVKDVLLAGTLEVGQGFRNYLYGVGLSLNLPKFNFADLNVYVRNDPKQAGSTYQVTPCWQLPFTVGKADMIFEGFTDIAGSEGDLSFNIDAQPRLLMDLGKFWDAPGSVFVGTEVIYWHNKYGVKGVNEFAPQAMIKFVM
ncbi:DUF5020 domain-containing protein [Geomonas subterranea]|uniref:DUF5020 domain-containing protein n=1 Tax=Geomonas subterranea TaxID=2847989 RepID=A0ABX8LHL4_9BACT|nr:outer membrane protein OmpK [Geomonas subterranea]QXE90222.1 DUF5020 domain-containing protein [Geomonas subterranea]QXM07653.1 DUF5020 domain-containing protein [Geomonas subterranea]